MTTIYSIKERVIKNIISLLAAKTLGFDRTLLSEFAFTTFLYFFWVVMYVPGYGRAARFLRVIYTHYLKT